MIRLGFKIMRIKRCFDSWDRTLRKLSFGEMRKIFNRIMEEREIMSIEWSLMVEFHRSQRIVIYTITILRRVSVPSVQIWVRFRVSFRNRYCTRVRIEILLANLRIDFKRFTKGRKFNRISLCRSRTKKKGSRIWKSFSI